ncbi:hypothetical protein [Phytohabitans suffuscus]|uniref:Uncharacterized protein n=1 Tax=Phytohabitans suffuscus TaxID=624315 RepID=A0A6F8YQM3_9ACTN|nr:hypothetical protein [Phytohabitans suffuscus]BCB88485.1 hypothetical protein Psuf_057980 [Phytohabitans suffuscus]
MTALTDAPARPATTYRTDLVTALLSGWFTVGLLLDAWAHNNVPELETFFTPWHAVFYWGFVATAGWIGWTCRHALRSGRPDLRALPPGYRPAVFAVAGFAVAGIADFSWHSAFGIEQNIDILFSPSHLGLAVAMLVIVTTPLRAAWARPDLPAAPGLRRLLPSVLSVTFASTLVLLFLQYANAFSYVATDVVVGLSNLDEDLTAEFTSAVLVTNLVLVVPLLALARRWVVPPGTATILYSCAAVLCAAVTGFANTALVLGLVGAGAAVDLLAAWLRPGPARPARVRLFAALVPLVIWTIYVATAYVASGQPRFIGPDGTVTGTTGVVELYTGLPVVQSLLALLVAVLLTTARPPVVEPTR